jgi:hypothetical protein
VEEGKVLCKQKMQGLLLAAQTPTPAPTAQLHTPANPAGMGPHTLTTVAVSIPQLHLDKILHPKRVTDTALGE